MSAQLAIDEYPTDRATTEALAAGLLSSEAARRVGWAKAYEALRRIDGLEEDLRQTRDELKYLRRAYSRLLGLVQNSQPSWGAVALEELARHFAAERTFRVQGAWDEGAAIAFEDRGVRKGWSPERAAKTRLLGQFWERVRKERDQIARRGGHSIKVDWSVSVAAEEFADGADGVALVKTCRCGESSQVRSKKELNDWREEHLSQAAFGMSKDAWFAARNLELDQLIEAELGAEA